MYLRPFTSQDGRDALIRHLRSAAALDDDPASASVVRAPTTVIWGERDPFLPASARTRLLGTEAGIPTRVRPIKDARHFTPEEVPRVVADAVAELLELSP
jgi:pimeloyl-ACP methyl ester carboxylesterase